MTPLVIDSSVAIKWLVPEDLSLEARHVQSFPNPLHSIDFIDLEMAAVLWKKQ